MTNDENNRELNEFFYELATGLALPTTIPAIFDRALDVARLIGSDKVESTMSGKNSNRESSS